MACCSKITDVIPSIESLGNRVSQNAIAPFKRARDRLVSAWLLTCFFLLVFLYIALNMRKT